MKTPSRSLPHLAAAVSAVAVLFSTALHPGPVITIYNDDFAVVRETVPLTLTAGFNRVDFTNATRHLEPNSVILRDPSGRVDLRILEQSYRAEVATAGLLLQLNEGREIDFLNRHPDGSESIVRGRVIRSGHARPTPGPGSYGHRSQPHDASGPVIEVDGQLRFSLPGEPLFPALTDDAILRPTLSWALYSSEDDTLEAELGYLTRGLAWSATYNLLGEDTGDAVDMVGWVTINNHTGRTFEDARLRLMAGKVAKLRHPAFYGIQAMGMPDYRLLSQPPPEVTHRAFDEYYLYELPLRSTLRNQETKQIEFLRAQVPLARTIYLYQAWKDVGVTVIREIENTSENQLGLPLPQGTARFYRSDRDGGTIEFVGENTINHTPRNETVRLPTGVAFDLVGERTVTDVNRTRTYHRREESILLVVRNRKQEAVEILLQDRLREWEWDIVEATEDYRKLESHLIEFTVTLEPDEIREVRYQVYYY